MNAMFGIDTTPLGLETFVFSFSQGSRSGNPGLEDRTPLGFLRLVLPTTHFIDDFAP